MSESYTRFLALSARDQKDVFEAAADRLDTRPSYVEKDFWVCFVLDALYKRLPDGHPQLLFKGGTALSKAYKLINRFSEDIDLVVYRDGLGFAAERDPMKPEGISGNKRKALIEELKNACGTYIRGDLAEALKPLLDERCSIAPDDEDDDQQTLLIEYPTLYPSTEISYVLPRVKLEAGARSALDPNATASVMPYVAEELNDGWSFAVDNIHVIAPQRTYLEKLLILHGAFCGHRDEGRVPADSDRISRHYYDVAMITGTEIGRSALADDGLLAAVREYNLIAFRQAWKKFEEATPGSICVVPTAELRAAIAEDYAAMQGMMLGEAPPFDWIMEQLQVAEDAINRR
jgi:hypothetical protein